MSKDIEGSVAAIVMVKAESMQTLADNLCSMLKNAGLHDQAQAMLNVSAALEVVQDTLDSLPGIDDGMKAMKEMFS